MDHADGLSIEDILGEIRASEGYRGQISSHRVFPATPPVYKDLRRPLPEELRANLAARGIDRLYAHQVLALEKVRAGRNIVVVTGTASGKTLCYNLPVLEEWLKQKETRALYLYPTKALAQDQLKALHRLTEGLPVRPMAGTYDGDTSPSSRKKLRDDGQIIMTNPDMLHQGILPKHPAWGGFFANLRFVVIDEVHVYRGVFGSNVANVIKRLQRICRHYGSNPIFICTSATIANPQEHAGTLLGKPVDLVEQDGAPHSEKHFILWNPPFLDGTRTERRSVNLEAADLMAMLIARRISTITFARARVVTELIYRYTQERLQRVRPSLVNSIRPYRGGYLPGERREIEEQLFAGRLLGVTSTNALELGIDIGSLGACLIVGYPGTIASFWQQAGRVGRGELPSLVFFLGMNAPIDQYLLRYENYLFDKNPEAAVIDPYNPHIILGHLRAAAYEAPISYQDEGEFGKFAPAVKSLLEEAGEVLSVHAKAYWRGRGFPAGQVNLRNISEHTFSIFEEEGKKIIGTMDEDSAYQQLYTEAVYLHDGEAYFVHRLDLEERVAYVHKADLDYYTQSITEVQIRIAEEEMKKEWRRSWVRFGMVEVMTKPYLFRKIKFSTRESLGFGPIDLPTKTMDTCALWLTPELAIINRVKALGRDVVEGFLGLANVLTEVLPFLVMSDSMDIGSTVDLANTGAPTIFLYDKYPGGVGFAQRAYEMVEEVFRKALDLITACECADGCPSCVGSPLPPHSQLDPDTAAKGRIPDKEGALIILHELLELEPYIPKPKPVGEYPPASGDSQEEAGEPPPFTPLPETMELRIRKQLQNLQVQKGVSWSGKGKKTE